MFLLVPAYPGCPGQKPLNACVCVCVCVFLADCKYGLLVLADNKIDCFLFNPEVTWLFVLASKISLLIIHVLMKAFVVECRI